MKHWRMRVLVVEDHTVMREGLCHILSGAPGVAAVLAAVDCTGALRHLEAGDADVAVVDLDIANAQALGLIKRIRTQWPRVPVLAVAREDLPGAPTRACSCGASGFVAGGASSAMLVKVLFTVARGGLGFPAGMASERAPGRLPALPHERLSGRELATLRMIVAGTAPARIALDLGVSVKTVETYRARLKRKLGARGTSDLVRYAVEHRVVG